MPDKDEQKISSLYQREKRELPSTASDDMVLNAARKALSEKPHPVSPFSGRWNVPLSLAAVILLSIILVTILENERPDIFDGIAESDLVVTEQSQPAKNSAKANEEAFPQSTSTSNTAPPIESHLVDSPSIEIAEGEPARQKQQSTTDTSTQIASQNENQLRKKARFADQIAASTANELARTEERIEQGEAVTSELAEQTLENRMEKLTPAKPEDPQAVASISRANVENRNQQAPAPLPNVKSKLKEITEQEPVAQDSTIPEQKAFSRELSTVAGIAAPTNACLNLSEQLCMSSTDCVLDTDNKSKKLICRQANTYCEHGFIQQDASKNVCEQKPGCQFIPSQCIQSMDSSRNCDEKFKIPAMCTPIED